MLFEGRDNTIVHGSITKILWGLINNYSIIKLQFWQGPYEFLLFPLKLKLYENPQCKQSVKRRYLKSNHILFLSFFKFIHNQSSSTVGLMRLNVFLDHFDFNVRVHNSQILSNATDKSPLNEQHLSLISSSELLPRLTKYFIIFIWKVIQKYLNKISKVCTSFYDVPLSSQFPGYS